MSSTIRIASNNGEVVVRKGVVRTRKNKLEGSFARVSFNGRKVMVYRGYGKRLFSFDKPTPAETPRTRVLSVRAKAKLARLKRKRKLEAATNSN